MSRSNRFWSPFILIFFLSTLISSGFEVSDRNERYKRPDPLRSFKYYNGGFDVRDKHYWASAAFAGGGHGYVIAGVWSLLGLSIGIFLALKNIKQCVASSSSSSSASSSTMIRRFDRHYRSMFLLLLLFTFLALVATGIVIATNQNARQRSQRLKDTIAKAGNDAGKTINSVVNAMNSIQNVLVPYDQKTTRQLNATAHLLGNESRVIQRFVQKNGRSIDLAIQTSYILHLVVASVNLTLLIFAFVPLMFHWHPGFIIIILVCWILTALFWVLTGFDFFLRTFSEDLCLAFDGFVKNPENNSLSTILPCLDPIHSNKILLQISLTIHSFISQLNMKIAETIRLVGPQKLTDDYVGVGTICDPFSGLRNFTTYKPQNCHDGGIPIGQFPNILSRFTCYKQDSPETCRTAGKFIPEVYYKEAWAYSTSVQNMLDIFPDLQNLAECRVIEGTITDIVLNQCKPFMVSVRRLWESVLVLSILTVVLVLVWLVKAFQERGQSFYWCSITPVSHETGC